MKLALIFAFLALLGIGVGQAHYLLQDFDRTAFYKAIETGKMEEIDHELSLAVSSAIREKEAYEGTLLMRKSGMVAVAAQKLRLFKEGRIKLETALLKDSTNGEYHFLRLVIQEHAPKIVRYHDQLEADKQFVKRSFPRLSPAIQQAILNYSRSSTVVHPQDF